MGALALEGAGGRRGADEVLVVEVLVSELRDGAAARDGAACTSRRYS